MIRKFAQNFDSGKAHGQTQGHMNNYQLVFNFELQKRNRIYVAGMLGINIMCCFLLSNNGDL